ncbi:tyrosine--tRNA ligase [Candidatus Gracilibacteria bacterium]|nr:tyrosine--tRNA ligase [Candidatus Gracilibacteria bacterium]
MNKKEIIENILTRGVAQIVDKEVLRKKLEKNPKKVIIKYGVDPTRPDLHLGHAVCLRKLRQFQQLGCKVIFLVGDLTAQIGDPSGKSKVRPETQQEAINKNMKTYLEQVGRLLIINDKEVFSWITNSDWFLSPTDVQANEPGDLVINGVVIKDVPPTDFIAKAVIWRNTRMQKERISNTSFVNFLATLRHITHSQLIERDMFKKRIKNEEALFMHEMIYPVIQGLDSQHIANIYGSCDLELGGTDQHFNMLMGRDVMVIQKTAPQAVLSVPIIEGLDGKEKMSKSLDNYIGVTESPNEMFGKIMSIPDNLMLKYFELLTDEDLKEVQKLIKSDPRNAKVHLAKHIVTWLHSAKDADMAEQDFITKFVKKETPDEMPEFEVGKKEIGILDLIVDITKFAPSKSEARRLVEQGGVSFGGEILKDPNALIQIKDGKVLKVGKRKFAKIRRKK